MRDTVAQTSSESTGLADDQVLAKHTAAFQQFGPTWSVDASRPRESSGRHPRPEISRERRFQLHDANVVIRVVWVKSLPWYDSYVDGR